MKTAQRVSILILIAAVVAVAVPIYLINQYLDAPINPGGAAVDFEIRPGSSFSAVASELESTGVIRSASILSGYARWTGQAAQIQAGEYTLSGDSSPRELIEQFTRGDVRLYSFTIIEGWNRWELLAALNSAEALESTLTEEDWPEFLSSLGAETDSPEGLFLPETYRFGKGTTARTILKNAYELMQETLTEEWDNRSDDAAVNTPYEALILASIIEKETGRVDERARIAGVFTRRLNVGMRLQTDPTVIYGIGPTFNGDITRRDLRTDTPWNTYTRGGLPPTPIAMPGRDAIEAALNPEDGEELYFVATGLGDGGHTFSVTREEHEAAVDEYLRRQRSSN